jgi:molecular chaperone IbpA
MTDTIESTWGKFQNELQQQPKVVGCLVCGFRSENEIEIELKENLLTVSGEQIKRDDVTYLHKGLGTRNYVRTFPLGEHVEVKGATVKNGILTVDLELIVPEEKQSKKIAITFQK